MSDHKTALTAKALTTAFLFAAGYLDLETANEQLQSFAEKSGCIRVLGNHEVQEIIAAAFNHIDIEPLDINDSLRGA
jgi:hypothetical protein